MKNYLLIFCFIFIGNSMLRGQWFSQYVTPEHDNLFCVKFLNQDAGLAAGEGGLIHRTTNGGLSWSSQQSGVETTLYSIFIVELYKVFIVGSQGVILKSADFGLNCTLLTSNTTRNLRSVFFVNENIGWAVGDSGIIIKTTDSGSSWSEQNSGVSDDLYSVHFTDQDTGWVAGHNGIIRRTTDGGNSWTNQSLDAYLDFYSIFFIDNNTGWVAGYDKIFNTVNGGNDWTHQPTGSSNLYYSIHFIDSLGWAVGNYGVIFNTINRGADWIRQTVNGQPFFSIPLLSVNFADKYIGWAAGIGGIILKTTNGGGLFTTSIVTSNASAGSQTLEVNSTDGFSVGNSIIINPGGTNEETNIISGFGSILLQTPLQFDHQAGELIANLTPTAVEDIDNHYPNEYALFQNYPNPFNPGTLISYQLPEGSNVSLKVFDILGNEIVTLINEYKPAGKYQVEFDIAQSAINGRRNEISVGVYFYQLRAGNYVDTKKMMLLK